MVTLFRRVFIPNENRLSVEEKRTLLGSLCSMIGIGLNICLFLIKFFAGTISGSIAITADAFNNLSDAGASLITLLGFRLAEKKPDRDHPFGHGRIEYVSGFVVSMVIILMGVELLKSAAEKILHPEEVVMSTLVICLLLLSIIVKLYMVYYNRKIGKELDSGAMLATATDSLGDCVSTGVVLLSGLIAKMTGLPLDGYTGLLVGFFVIWAGVGTAKDTLNPLLGQPPKPEFVHHVKELVMAHDYVLGIHDLIVHDYGPGRMMISLHAEVPADGDLLEMHDAIDHIEKEVGEKLRCEVVIHMDPIITNDSELSGMQKQVEDVVLALEYIISMHDFRMVKGPTHTNLVFDVVVPVDMKCSEEELLQQIDKAIKKLDPRYFAVVQIDRALTEAD